MKMDVIVVSSLLSLFLLTSCAVHDLDVTPIDTQSVVPVTVSSPVKVHLKNGSTVVFKEGIKVAGGQVTGDGRKYDLTLDSSIRVSTIALDDVAAMESYQTPIQTGDSIAASAGVAVGSTIGVAAAALLAKVIFGSCPTTYSVTEDGPILEAESFSYSIAPSFEARDVDRLNVPDTEDETVKLIVRNEALETHYINHLELLEVIHDPGQRVFPDPHGIPLTVGSLNTQLLAVDREGQSIQGMLNHPDNAHWSSNATRLHRASLADFEDHIDVEFETPHGADQIALVFRLRNSLLNTVLLYDVMLKDQGFRALDWLGQDLNRFVNKARLGLWYRDRMGMRISVWDGDKFRQVARVGDQGPIAWKEMAVKLPVLEDGRMRARLSFVVDNWRIDWLAVSPEIYRPHARRIPLATVHAPETTVLDGALKNLAMADKSYVVARPGDALHVGFSVGTVPEGRTRTFMMAAQGYYIEWMRRGWLNEAVREPFKPSDEALLKAIRLWEAKRDRFQERFESLRIAHQ